MSCIISDNSKTFCFLTNHILYTIFNIVSFCLKKDILNKQHQQLDW
jgi:hypothetical protein